MRNAMWCMTSNGIACTLARDRLKQGVYCEDTMGRQELLDGLMKRASRKVRDLLPLDQLHFMRAKTASRLNRIKVNAQRFGLEGELPSIEGVLQDLDSRIASRIDRIRKVASREALRGQG